MTSEYNKIHAMARARKLTIETFGADLMNLWPLADDSEFIRDLLRRKPLVGSGVTLKADGLLDYGVNLGSGHLSDVVSDVGNTNCSSSSYSREDGDYEMAVPIPAGRWSKITFKSTRHEAITGAVAVAPPDTAPGSVSAGKLIEIDSVVDTQATLSNIKNTTAFYTDGQINSSYPRMGHEHYLFGNIYQVKAYLKKFGSPTGTAYLKLYSTGGSLLATAGTTLDVSTVSTSGAWYTFTFNCPYKIWGWVRVVVEYSGGDSSNRLGLGLTQGGTSNVFGDWVYDSGGWVQDSTYDAMMEVYYSGGPSVHSVTLPVPLDADDDDWWAFFKKGVVYDSSNAAYGQTGKVYSGSAWSAQNNVVAKLEGASAGTWASRDQFTVGVVADVDGSPGNGTLLALSNGTEAKVSLRVKSDKKVEAVFKNTNGDTVTLTSTDILHPGSNVIVASYADGASPAAKLSVNGQVVATGTPTNYPLLDGTFALGIGAKVLSDKTVSDQLKDAIVDDVFIAKSVPSDASLWDLYLAYITAAPMMQFEDVTPA
ncbi:MAG: hypothetical protein HY678_02800 [Chloroflexi bacterium]|nr:hypothetical protein [Chloroflexota bacterium]